MGLLTNGQSVDLNYSVSDTNLDTCWRDYNGVNTTIASCANTTFTYVSGVNSIKVWANDTFGNKGSNTSVWGSNIEITNIVYNANTIETSSETFVLNITYNSSLYTGVSATFIYNNTIYSSTVTTVSSSNVIFSNTLIVPTVSSEINMSFNWNVTLTGGTTNNFITSIYNQTVSPILLSVCGGITNTTSISFITKDEATFALLNSSIEINLQYGLDISNLIKTYTYQNLTDGFSNYSVCINPIYGYTYINGIVSYYKSGYDRRDYFFTNALVNNLTQTINLYLLNTSSSDIFTFTVKDEADQPVSGAYIYVERWDIGTSNFYTTAVLQTDTNGNTFTNLRLYDAWYRYKVVYNGVLRLVEGPVKESTTTRTLRIVITTNTDPITGDNQYTVINDIIHSLTFNNVTNTFAFNYLDNSGSTNMGCLKIGRMYMNTTSIIYNSCINSVSGTLNYAVTENGTYAAYGTVTLNENYTNYQSVVDTLVRTVGVPERFSVINTYGRAISFIAIGTVAMLGVASGSLIIGFGLVILTALGLDLIGLLNFTSPSTVLFSLIALVLMIIITTIRRSGRR